MGVSALVLAAAFAVAFALLASSAPNTAEAGDPEGTAIYHVGDVIEVTAPAAGRGGTVTFTLNATAELKGVFVHSQSGTLTCRADADAVEGAQPMAAIESACDKSATGDGANDVTVEFRIGSGTTNGFDLGGDGAGAFTATTPDVDTDTDSDPQPAIVEALAGTAYGHAHKAEGVAGQTVTVTFDLTALGAHATDPDTTNAGPGPGNFYRISDTSVGSGTFVANDGTSIDCADTDSCDVARVKGDAKAANQLVGLEVAISDDSSKGSIIVERLERRRGDTALFRDEIVINVTSVKPTVATLSLKADPLSVAAKGGEADLTVTMRQANDKAAAGQRVTLIATRGTFPDCGNNQLCEVVTGADGTVTTTFRGAAVGGVATITATSGELQRTVSITLHSGASEITADEPASSLQAEGSSEYIVVTVADKDGNPIQGMQPTATVKSGPAAGDTLVDLDRDQDYKAGTSSQIPACGDDADSEKIKRGTDKNGQCVIQVTAPKGAGMGVHTVTVRLPRDGADALTDEVGIKVVGKPASLSVAAPRSVEPFSDSKITVTVYDASGDLAAANEVRVSQIEGDGHLEPEMKDTKAGVASFDFIAPSGGAAVFVIDAGKAPDRVRETLTITVGTSEPTPEPAPEPEPTLSVQRTTSGIALATFSGGTVEELGAALTAACGEGSRAWATESDGDWVSYNPSAPIPLLNVAFKVLFADGLGANTPLVVTECS